MNHGVDDRYIDVSQAVRSELALLTADEVSTLLQVKKSWIYDQVQSRRFPAVRLGRQLRFRPHEVQAYLEGSWQIKERAAEPDTPAPQRVGRPRKRL